MIKFALSASFITMVFFYIYYIYMLKNQINLRDFLISSTLSIIVAIILTWLFSKFSG